MTADAFTAWCRPQVGHAERFHRDLYRRLMREGRFRPAASPLWQEAEAARPGTIAALEALAAEDQALAVSATMTADDPEHGTTSKFLCRLGDGASVESVLIPMGGPDAHHTVCVSSQVGCRMGCTFCQTATMGLVRNLAAHEIVGQVLTVRRHSGIAPRNVVFMGMGEPLDNAEAVAQAVAVLADRGGLSLRHRHITVSTVGRADVLARWRGLGLEGINLAVSLTTADEGLRRELMPITVRHPLSELKQVLQTIPLKPGRRILFGCVVIPGVTDTPQAVEQLLAWLAGLPALVNLIPYNPIPDRPWRVPEEAEMLAVRDRLDAAGIAVRQRLTKGETVMAACGQLGTRLKPRRRDLPVAFGENPG